MLPSAADTQTFDYALAAGCFSHGVVPKETINEMWRVTKVGYGHVIRFHRQPHPALPHRPLPQTPLGFPSAIQHGGRLAYSIRKSVYDNEESGFQAIHEDMLGRDEVRSFEARTALASLSSPLPSLHALSPFLLFPRHLQVRLIAEESGTYLAKDNVEAVYFCWEVLHK